MTGRNKTLLIVAVALLALSAFTYWDEVSRADRFERGQKLLQSIDPDQIATIVVEGGEETVTLVRQGDAFQVRERSGYNARNDSINRLIRAVLDVELQRKVGEGAARAAELGLAAGAGDTMSPEGSAATQVTFRNAAGDEMVRLAFVDASDAENSSYVQRRDGEHSEIYLTTARVFLDTEVREFLDREIVEHPASEIQRIEGRDFVLGRAEEGSALELQSPSGRETDSSAVSRLTSLLNRLRFDEVHVADAPEVADLEFQQRLRFDLVDQSSYLYQVAERGEEIFLRIQATYGVDRLEITREETDEELQEKSDILKRSDEVVQFNAYHGSWVYRLESFDAEKLSIGVEDLTKSE